MLKLWFSLEIELLGKLAGVAKQAPRYVRVSSEKSIVIHFSESFHLYWKYGLIVE